MRTPVSPRVPPTFPVQVASELLVHLTLLLLQVQQFHPVEGGTEEARLSRVQGPGWGLVRCQLSPPPVPYVSMSSASSASRLFFF